MYRSRGKRPARRTIPGSPGTAGGPEATACPGTAGSLIIRPPRDAHGAGWRLALGLALLFVLAPASRVGYFVYPLSLAAWLLLSRWPELPGDLWRGARR